MTTTDRSGGAGRSRRPVPIITRIVVGALSLSLTAFLYAGMEMASHEGSTAGTASDPGAPEGQVTLVVRRDGSLQGSQRRLSPATGAPSGSSAGAKARAKSRAS